MSKKKYKVNTAITHKGHIYRYGETLEMDNDDCNLVKRGLVYLIQNTPEETEPEKEQAAIEQDKAKGDKKTNGR